MYVLSSQACSSNWYPNSLYTMLPTWSSLSRTPSHRLCFCGTAGSSAQSLDVLFRRRMLSLSLLEVFVTLHHLLGCLLAGQSSLTLFSAAGVLPPCSQQTHAPIEFFNQTFFDKKNMPPFRMLWPAWQTEEAFILMISNKGGVIFGIRTTPLMEADS